MEVELNGRIAKRFFLNASYVWSQSKGTVPGGWEGTGNYLFANAATFSFFGSRYSGPADSPYSYLTSYYVGTGGLDYGDEGWYGFLPYSCDHVVKAMGTYMAPFDFVLTMNFEFYSGYYYSKMGLVPESGAHLSFPFGRGTEKAPSHSYLDLSLEKSFSLPAGVSLALRLNVTNILNSQQPVTYMNAIGAMYYGEVYARQFPRWFQFQVRLRF